MSWWFTHRPSYILYKAKQLQETQDYPKAIARYESLLAAPDLKPADEVRFRIELARLYFERAYGTEVNVLKNSGEEDSYRPSLNGGEAVIEQLEKALKIDPKNAEAHYLMGMAYWAESRQNFATEEFREAVRLNPNDARSLKLLGEIRLQHDRYDEAEQYFHSALRIDPEEEDTRLLLAEVELLKGLHQKALSEIQKLAVSRPDDPRIALAKSRILAEENQYDQAQSEIQKALAQLPDDAAARLARADLFLSRHYLDDARAETDRASELAPSSLPVFLEYVKIDAAGGNCSEAQERAQFLLNNAGNFPDSHLAAAQAHLCGNQDNEALSQLDQALTLAPELSAATLLKAEVFIAKGFLPEAEMTLKASLQSQGPRETTYALLSECLLKGGEVRLAEDAALAALEQNPNSTEGVLALARAQGAGHQDIRAENSFRRALELNPRHAAARAAYARFLTGQGSLVRSGEQIDEALKIDPREAQIWVASAELCAQLGKMDEALQRARTALQLKAYDIDAELILAALTLKEGHPDQARAYLQIAEQINPRYPGIAAFKKTLGKT